MQYPKKHIELITFKDFEVLARLYELHHQAKNEDLVESYREHYGKMLKAIHAELGELVNDIEA